MHTLPLPTAPRLFLSILALSAAAVSAVELPSELLSGKGGGMGMNLRQLMGEDEEGQVPSLDISPLTTDAVLEDSVYVVGPGDQFQIFIESASLVKQVTAEGDIVLNRIGPIPVTGLTLRQAKKKILERVQTYRIKSQCFVSLSRPKTFMVFVTGAVRNPGAYHVLGSMRVSDAILQARGFSGHAQRGPLVMTTRDGRAVKADIRRFLMEGDLASNPYLIQGAVLHVPFLDPSAPSVTVRRDSSETRLQLADGETLERVLQRLDWFNQSPALHAVYVTEKGASTVQLGAGELATYAPKPGAQVEVVIRNVEVYVGGAVARPGFLPYRSNLKISQYLALAGLLTSSKMPDRIEVRHQDGKISSLPINDGFLKPGDILQVEHNREQKILMYTPLLISVASLGLTILSVILLNQN